MALQSCTHCHECCHPNGQTNWVSNPPAAHTVLAVPSMVRRANIKSRQVSSPGTLPPSALPHVYAPQALQAISGGPITR